MKYRKQWWILFYVIVLINNGTVSVQKALFSNKTRNTAKLKQCLIIHFLLSYLPFSIFSHYLRIGVVCSHLVGSFISFFMNLLRDTWTVLFFVLHKYLYKNQHHLPSFEFLRIERCLGRFLKTKTRLNWFKCFQNSFYYEMFYFCFFSDYSYLFLC